jgi:hypothetical protein
MVLHTSYLQRKTQKVKRMKLSGLTREGCTRDIAVPHLRFIILRRRFRQHIWNILIFGNTKDKQLYAKT